MAIDPDVQVMLDAIETRLKAVEASPGNEAEIQASLAFNAALFATLSATDDRVAVWQKLTDALRG
jgi:hypothetical protein